MGLFDRQTGLKITFWHPNHLIINTFSPYGSGIAQQHIHIDSQAARRNLRPYLDFSFQRMWADYSEILRAITNPIRPLADPNGVFWPDSITGQH